MGNGFLDQSGEMAYLVGKSDIADLRGLESTEDRLGNILNLLGSCNARLDQITKETRWFPKPSCKRQRSHTQSEIPRSNTTNKRQEVQETYPIAQNS